MPLHTGHLTLIDHGLESCGTVTILLVVTTGEPIDPELRYTWLKDHYHKEKRVQVEVVCRDSINALPQEKRTAAWCNLIKEEFPSIDCIISSENYGDVLANFLGIKHLKFDHKRTIVPISATEIRDDHKKHIHYLPDHVKEFFSR